MPISQPEQEENKSPQKRVFSKESMNRGRTTMPSWLEKYQRSRKKPENFDGDEIFEHKASD
jgi:hypothetical protein